MPRQALSCWLELDSAGVATALPWMQERGVADWSSADDCSSSQPGVCLTLAHAPASSCETAATAWRFAASTRPRLSGASGAVRRRRVPGSGGALRVCATHGWLLVDVERNDGRLGESSVAAGGRLARPARAACRRLLSSRPSGLLARSTLVDRVLRLCFAIVVRFFELDAMRVFPLVWSPGDHAGAVVMLRRSVDARLVGW